MELYLRIDDTVQFAICEVDKIIIYEEVPLQDSLKYLYSNLFGMNMDSVFVFTHGSMFTDGEEHSGLCVSNMQIIDGGQKVNCSVYEPDDNVINIYYLCYLLMFDQITFIDESNLDVLVEGEVCHRRYGDGYLVSFRSGEREFVDYAAYSDLAIKLAEFGLHFKSSKFCDLDHLIVLGIVNRTFFNVKDCLQIIEEDHPKDADDAVTRFEHFLTLCLLPGILQERSDFDDITFTIYGDERQPNYVETAEDYKVYLEGAFDDDGNPLFVEEADDVEEPYSEDSFFEDSDQAYGDSEYSDGSDSEYDEDSYSRDSNLEYGEEADPEDGNSEYDEEPYLEEPEPEPELVPAGKKQKKIKEKKQKLPKQSKQAKQAPAEEDYLAEEEELADLNSTRKGGNGLKILVILVVVVALSIVAIAVAFNIFSKRDAVVLNAQISDKQVDLEEQQAIYEHYENYLPNASELIRSEALSAILDLKFPGYLGEIQFLEDTTTIVVYLTTPDDLDKVKKIFTSVGELVDTKTEGSVALKNGILYKYTFSFNL